MKTSTVVAVAVAACMAFGAQAQTQKGKAKEAARPDWVLIQSVDKMTDKKTCLVGYTKNPNIWLETDISLRASYRNRGGLKAYQYRIGDAPAVDLVLAGGQEKATQSFELYNFESNKLFEAKRVFVRAITVLDNVVEDDIDLTHIADARRLLAQCAGSTS